VRDPNLDTVDHAEALEWMNGLPDSCVDLIVTDPPYFKVKDEAWDRQWAKPEAFIAWLGTIEAGWPHDSCRSDAECTLLVEASWELVNELERRAGVEMNAAAMSAD
jgi:hypothetical protein